MDAAFFEQYRKAWNAHDLDAILDFFADDGVYEDVAASRVNRGKDQMRQFFSEAFAAFPDFHVSNEPPMITSDGRFSLEWTLSGTHEGDLPGLPATHKSFSVRGVSAGELAGDKIKRNSDYWNFAEVLVQLGILPPMPSP